MRLFAYEYTTAVGPLSGEGTSLAAEGWAMLTAVVEDFSRIAGVEIMTLAHVECGRRLGQTCVTLQDGDEASVFKRLAAAADFTLVIAPEFNNVLVERCRWVLEAGGRLLGSTPGAVALAGDKLALSEHLRKASISTPATILLSDFNERTGLGGSGLFPAVCKPRHGAGSQATFLVQDANHLDNVRELAALEMPGAELMLQCFIHGHGASVAFLVGPGGIQPLLPATQELSNDGRFRYQGGQLPLPAALAKRAVCLGRRAVEAVPGLLGYVGVDLVLGEKADGKQDSVIEINPRLTTSYIGLRRLARGNLAEAMLATVVSTKIPEVEWHPGRLRFYPDGPLEAV